MQPGRGGAGASGFISAHTRPPRRRLPDALGVLKMNELVAADVWPARARACARSCVCVCVCVGGGEGGGNWLCVCVCGRVVCVRGGR
jgi:hypothetical protein